MIVAEGINFDPETLQLLKAALEDAWDSLSPQQQSSHLKSDMATRILRCAGQGERDKLRLRAAALLGLA